MKTFTAIIEKSEKGGYFAYCLEVKGANGQGETVEDCCEDLKLAIQLVLEELKKGVIPNLSSSVICKEIIVA